jgi:hypothetical protein
LSQESSEDEEEESHVPVRGKSRKEKLRRRRMRREQRAIQREQRLTLRDTEEMKRNKRNAKVEAKVCTKTKKNKTDSLLGGIGGCTEYNSVLGGRVRWSTYCTLYSMYSIERCTILYRTGKNPCLGESKMQGNAVFPD